MSATKDAIKDTTLNEATERAKEGGNYVASSSLNQECTSDDKEKTANIRANAAQEAEDDSIASREEEKEKEEEKEEEKAKAKERQGNPPIKETTWFS